MSCNKTTLNENKQSSNAFSNCILQLNVNLNISWWINNGELNYVINSTPSQLKVEPFINKTQNSTLQSSTLQNVIPLGNPFTNNSSLSNNDSNRYQKYVLSDEIRSEGDSRIETYSSHSVPIIIEGNPKSQNYIMQEPNIMYYYNNSNNKDSLISSSMKCETNDIKDNLDESNDSGDLYSEFNNDDSTGDIDDQPKNNYILTPMYIRTLFPYSKDIVYENIKMTEVGLYSISNRHDSGTLTRILNQCILSWNLKTSSIVVTDGTAGIGGNSIAFAMMFKKVNAIEIDNVQYNALVNNVDVYRLNNVDTYIGNCLKIIPLLEQHIIFLDPPWGGRLYKKEKKLDLSLSGIPLVSIVNLWKKKCTNLEMIALKIPKNFGLANFAKECDYPFLYLLFFRKYNVLILSKRLCKPIEHRHFKDYKKKRRNSI